MSAYESRPLSKEAASDVNVAADTPIVDLCTDNYPWAERFPVGKAAIANAADGLPVFPLSLNKKPLGLCQICHEPGACPGKRDCVCGVDTCHGFHAATTDPAVISNWFTGHPFWNVGLATGAVSGLVALDVDVDHGGLDSFIGLLHEGLDITGAAVQLSGSGRSFHVIYSHPGGRVPCLAGRIGPGLDVRGDGGYVVAAPSRHPDTKARYELLGPLTDLPPWPLGSAAEPAVRATATRLVGTPRQAGRRSDDWGSPLTPCRVRGWFDRVAACPPGQRRSLLFWCSCRLGEASGTVAALRRAAERLIEAGMAAGLPAAEAQSTVVGGIRCGRAS